MLADELRHISPVSLFLRLHLDWTMGQGPSKDSAISAEEEQRHQKQKEEREEKERRKRERKEQKEKEKQQKKEQKEQKKRDKEEKEKLKKSGGKKRDSPENRTVRSRASQTTVRRTFPRSHDDDDISLDPVDNTPAYDDDINLDPVSASPTHTDSRPDQITVEEVKTLITRARANDPSLKSLSITGQATFKRMTRETKEEIQGLLADALQGNTFITELHLTKLGLDDAFAVSLAHSLTSNRTLSILNLNGNEISGVGVQALANVLAVNASLREVSLRNQDAKLGVEGEEAMLAILETNRTLVKLELDLMDQKVSKWINQRLAENLKRLSLPPAPLPQPSSQNFFVLTPLRLKVMALITNNCDEEILDFANEDEFASFTEQEKTAVAGGLGINDQVKKADFSNTRLTDSFAQVLSMSLQSNDSLTSLGLENNQLSPEGLKAIASALKTNKTLKELRIGRQQEQEEFGRELEEFFAECLSHNRCLVTLKMKIATKEIQERVEECLRRNAQA